MLYNGDFWLTQVTFTKIICSLIDLVTLSIIQYLYYDTTFQNSDERVLGVSGSKHKLYHYSLAVLQVLLFAPGNTILNIIPSCEFKVPHET